MKIKVMSKGDKVLNVTSELVAIQRKNGEVDVFPLISDESGVRIDTENIVTMSDLWHRSIRRLPATRKKRLFNQYFMG